MSFCEIFRVPPDSNPKLAALDSANTLRFTKNQARKIKSDNTKCIGKLQYNLYAENRQSLLIILQALDAGGKDGTIKDVMAAMNPQGCRVQAFKTPTANELARDFLWRVHMVSPKQGEVVVFNRSHYEDVLIARVHNLVPPDIWRQRYALINGFERLLTLNNTRIIKFFLHISKAEQLKRFLHRLEDPAKHWKISLADYSERHLWDNYQEALEDVFAQCSPETAPWYIIPANHKWFRNLAISQIIKETLENMHIEGPRATVNIDEIRQMARAEQQAAKTANNPIQEQKN